VSRLYLALAIFALSMLAVFSDRIWKRTANWWARLRFAYQYEAQHSYAYFSLNRRLAWHLR
jgi:hypothetical protein